MNLSVLPKFPLFRGSLLEVCEPPLDFFLKKIENNQSFNLVREQSEWWHVIYEGLKHLEHGCNIEKYNFQDPDFLDILTSSMRKNYFRIGGSRGWVPHSFNVWRGCLSMIVSEKPENFYFSISHAALWNKDILCTADVPPPENFHHLLPRRPRAIETNLLISKMFPKSELLFRSTVWRKWGANSEIHKFFEKFGDEKIVLVGRDVYSNFGEKLRLSNFSYISVDAHKASERLNETENAIIKHHKELLKTGSDRIIYLMLAGDTTRYIQWRLHNKLDGNVFMIDAGRALDPYYREDRGFANNSPLWGHWHTSYKSWVKEKCPYVIR